MREMALIWMLLAAQAYALDAEGIAKAVEKVSRTFGGINDDLIHAVKKEMLQEVLSKSNLANENKRDTEILAPLMIAVLPEEAKGDPLELIYTLGLLITEAKDKNIPAGDMEKYAKPRLAEIAADYKKGIKPLNKWIEVRIKEKLEAAKGK